MRDDRETEYEVGFGKPPKSGQFKKGRSGNPSGRPKRPKDFGSMLLRELDSKLTINENGKRKVITKSEGVLKQLSNKSLSGHHPSTRLLMPLYMQELEKAAEQEQHAQHLANRTVDEMSDDELWAYVIADIKKAKSAVEMAEMLAELAKMLELKNPGIPVFPEILSKGSSS